MREGSREEREGKGREGKEGSERRRREKERGDWFPLSLRIFISAFDFSLSLSLQLLSISLSRVCSSSHFESPFKYERVTCPAAATGAASLPPLLSSSSPNGHPSSCLLANHDETTSWLLVIALHAHT